MNRWILGLLILATAGCQSIGNRWSGVEVAEDLAVESDFVPFADSDLYHGIMAGDELARLQIDADTAIPQSRLQPGESGGKIPGIEGFAPPKGGDTKVFQSVTFETDDYVIRGSQSLDTVQAISTYMKKHPKVYLFVEGHCDERGPAAYNLALGTRRANAVRNHLIKAGVNPDRLFTTSYGKERPLVAGHTATAWKQNRRGQFKLYTKS